MPSLIDRVANRLGFQRIIDTKQRAYDEIAAGIYYDMTYYNNWMEQYWNPNPVHRATQWTGYQLYDHMDADGHIYNVMSMRKVSQLSRPVVVRSAMPGDYTEDKKAALVKANLDSIKKILLKKRNILSNQDFGFSVTEMLFENRDVKLPAASVGRKRQFRGGTIENAFMIKDLRTKIPSAFSFDGLHNLYMTQVVSSGFGAHTAGANAKKLDAEARMHFIVATHEPRFDNDYGWPLKTPMFWDWLGKKALRMYRMIYVEKYGMPVTHGTYPPGSAREGESGTLKFFDNLKAIQKNSVVMSPEGFVVKFLDNATHAGSVDIFQNYFDYFDGNISETALGHRTAVSSQDTGQSPFSDGANEKAALRQDLLEMDAAALDSVFNDQVIPILCDMNFGTNGLYPYVKTIVEPEADLDKEIFRLQAAYNMKIPLSLSQIRDKFGWDEPAEGDPEDILLLEESKGEKGAVPPEKDKSEDKPNGKDSSQQNPNNMENAFREQAMSAYFANVAERMLKKKVDGVELSEDGGDCNWVTIHGNPVCIGGEGGSGGGGSDVESIKNEANEVARKYGFDGDIEFKEKPPTYKVGGMQIEAAAEYDHAYNQIRVFTPNVSKESIGGIMAHEVTHYKYDEFLDAYTSERTRLRAQWSKPDYDWKTGPLASDGTINKGYEKDYPVSSIIEGYDHKYPYKLEDMANDDGVSAYSKKWWDAYKRGERLPKSYHSAYHETLAEIAKKKHEAGGAWKPDSQRWENYFQEVNIWWDQQHGK